MSEMENEQPAFEVIDRVSGHIYRVWANGRIEGFGSATVVCNRIPLILMRAKAEAAAT